MEVGASHHVSCLAVHEGLDGDKDEQRVAAGLDAARLDRRRADHQRARAQLRRGRQEQADHAKPPAPARRRRRRSGGGRRPHPRLPAASPSSASQPASSAQPGPGLRASARNTGGGCGGHVHHRRHVMNLLAPAQEDAQAVLDEGDDEQEWPDGGQKVLSVLLGQRPLQHRLRGRRKGWAVQSLPALGLVLWVWCSGAGAGARKRCEHSRRSQAGCGLRCRRWAGARARCELGPASAPPPSRQPAP